MWRYILCSGNHEEDYIARGNEGLIQELTDAGAVVLDQNMRTWRQEAWRSGWAACMPMLLARILRADIMRLMTLRQMSREFLEEFQDTDRVKIMMSHRPTVLSLEIPARCGMWDLVVSAHDHGGQVVVPFLGGLYGEIRDGFLIMVHGLYQKDKIQLFVTSGLGSNKKALPRFNNPPEIAVLHITV